MTQTAQATRECPPWCTDDGHAGKLQGGPGAYRPGAAHNSQRDPVRAGWNVHDADVHTGLWRAYGEETAVLVVMDDRVQIKLTPSEGRQLAQHITDLCDEAIKSPST